MITKTEESALKRLRLARSLSLRKLARLSDVSHTLLYRLEKREIVTRFSTCRRIAHALDVNVQELEEHFS